MARISTRRSLRLESLETRQLLSTGTSNIEQYALEQLNKARTNPGQVAVDVTTNLTPFTLSTFQYYKVDIDQARNEIASTPAVAPLAWNDQLASAADGQAQDQADNGFQSHTGSDGSSLEDRLNNAGYTSRGAYGENAYAYADSVDQAMQAFLVDYGVSSKGHRQNIYNPNFREVGIGITPTKKSGVGPNVIVQDFGSQPSEKPFLLGVVFNDRDGDNAYSVGEGTNQLTITVTKVSGTDLNKAKAIGQPVDVTPWASGGYQVQLDPGQYKVVARSGSRVFRTQLVTIGQDNVKVDFDLSDAWQNSTFQPQVDTPAPVVTTQAATPTPTPVATPAPTQSLANIQTVGSVQRQTNAAFTGSWSNLSWRTWNGTKA